MNDQEKLQLANALQIHRQHNFQEFLVPDDISAADAERMAKEIRAKHPLVGIILRYYVSPDKVNGGKLYPDGRVLEPGETWRVDE